RRHLVLDEVGTLGHGVLGRPGRRLPCDRLEHLDRGVPHRLRQLGKQRAAAGRVLVVTVRALRALARRGCLLLLPTLLRLLLLPALLRLLLPVPLLLVGRRSPAASRLGDIGHRAQQPP